MKNVLLAVISTLALSNLVLAQDAANQIKNQDKSWYQELKDSPWGFQVLTDTEFDTTRRNKKMNRATTLNLAYIKYKLSDVDSLRLENRTITRKVFTPEPGQANDSDTYMDRMVLQYKRTGLMTQANDGINLSASMDLRYRPSDRRRNALNQYGLIRPNVVASRSFGKANASVAGYYAQMFQQVSGKVDTGKSYWYLITEQGYSFTDKFSMSFTQEWFAQNVSKEGTVYTDGDGNSVIARDDYQMLLTLSGSYQVHPQISLGLYTTAADNSFNDDSLKDFTTGFSVFATVF